MNADHPLIPICVHPRSSAVPTVAVAAVRQQRSVDAQCKIQLLGDLRIEQEGRIITRFRSRQTGALLAYLAFYVQRSHPRELLMELIWPGEALEAARDRLRVALSSLRRQLE